MKVLLVGSGGREHAIAWKLSQSKKLTKLYCAPGNPGTAQHGENIDIADTDVEGLVKFAQGADIGLAIIGPEDPLAAGAVDAFEAVGIKAFGPSGKAAQLEGDKAFAKEIMRANSIPTAESRSFTNFQDAKSYIASRDEAVVVKAAGLAKGKGVFVCDEPSEGILAAEQVMKDRIFGAAGDTVIVEDKLLGQEASILAFVDGRSIYVMESSQDHKPIGEDDTGPNTGGMGAYSPAPIVTDKLMDQITRRVLEYNVRFGDPETQPILMRLKSDLLDIMLAVCDGKLSTINLEWDPRPAVCVVMSSGGYPGDYEKGKVIEGLDEAGKMKDVFVFHAGTAARDGKIVTNGGRVLGVTALGETIADAKQRAYEAVDRIRFEGAYCRRDIADKAIK
ncbi:MAG: phosphoribosylamine--glycine ligase [Planctomycetota bacterium]|jgi:phosphoribosylamine--glycine ligase